MGTAITYDSSVQDIALYLNANKLQAWGTLAKLDEPLCRCSLENDACAVVAVGVGNSPSEAAICAVLRHAKSLAELADKNAKFEKNALDQLLL